MPTQRNFSQPAWNGGDPIAGKTILIHSEQGLGDTIQFCRYVPLVAARGAQVIFEVQKPLQSLMASLGGVAQVVPKRRSPSRFRFALSAGQPSTRVRDAA